MCVRAAEYLDKGSPSMPESWARDRSPIIIFSQ